MPWTLGYGWKGLRCSAEADGWRTWIVMSHDMAVTDFSIRPEGDCWGTDRVVGVNSWQLSCLTNFFHHVVNIIDAVRLAVVRHGIGRRPVSAGLLEKCRTFRVEFGKIELHSFIAIVWTVHFIHLCIFSVLLVSFRPPEWFLDTSSYAMVT